MTSEPIDNPQGKTETSCRQCGSCCYIGSFKCPFLIHRMNFTECKIYETRLGTEILPGIKCQLMSESDRECIHQKGK